MTFANRRDANATLLLKALEKLGFSVLDLSRVGGGCPDALIGKNQWSALVEVKSRDNAYGKRGLSDSQALWAAQWRGRSPIVAYDEQDVLRAYEADMPDRRRD